MNVLIVTQYFYPEPFRIGEVAVEFVRRDHHVEVVTALPNYPKGEVYEGYESKYEEDYFGVKIHRTNTRPRYSGSVNLFRNYLSFMIQASRRIRQLDGQFDVVFCYMPSPVFQLSPSIFAKKKYGAKLVCMCCDQWPESLKARNLNGGIAFDLIGKYCSKVFNACDHIVNVAPSFIDYNHRVNCVPKEKMSWCVQHSEDNFPDGAAVKTENLDTVDLMFAGNIGKVQNVEDIILAYDKLRYPDLRIHIFGDGSSFESCRKIVEERNLSDNVILYGRISAEELAGYYKKMDACLLTLSGKTAIGNTIPAKLPGYLSAGKMVIAAIGGDSRIIIDEAGCGIYTDPDDHEKLALLMDEFYRNKDKYAACGENGRVYFEKYCTLHFFTSEMEKIFTRLIRGDESNGPVYE